MNNRELSLKDYQILLFKAFLWLCLAWGGFILTLSGFFYASLVWIGVGLAAMFMIRKEVSLGVSLKISREFLFATLASILIAFVFSFFSEPSFFTGRDQGSFSEAAVRLAQNHKLEFSTPTSVEFFKLHEPGRAQNFPGFYYTKSGALVTQFSLVYISWLALFFATFGTAGFMIANGFLLFIFFLSFYMLLRLFLRPSSAIIATILAATSFPFMWFSKFSLSENMALPLIWIAILSLMLFLKNQRRLFYYVLVASISLLCFTRIEGAAFLVATAIIICCNKEARLFISSKTITRIFLPAFFLLIVFGANIYVDAFFYREILKAVLPSFAAPQAKYLGEMTNNVLPNFYTLKVFYLYGMLGFFIVGALSALFNFCKKEFYHLVPLFMVLPTFIYFFDSQITPDHPWMLRRFMFSLLPAAILYTGLLLGGLLETKSYEKNSKLCKASASVVIVILFVMNMPAFFKYATYIENKGLFTQTQELSSRFSSNDLILMDQKASGDGWSMLAGPMNYMLKKNSVYFFNNQDLSKLNTGSFSNIYLVVPNEQVPFYLNSTIGNKLTKTGEYELNTSRLETKQVGTLDDVRLPEKDSIHISGKIFKVSK